MVGESLTPARIAVPTLRRSLIASKASREIDNLTAGGKPNDPSSPADTV